MMMSLLRGAIGINNSTILTWKNLFFAEFSTKFIEIQGWLLLTFFICLLNQLISVNSIIVQMPEKRD